MGTYLNWQSGVHTSNKESRVWVRIPMFPRGHILTAFTDVPKPNRKRRFSLRTDKRIGGRVSVYTE